MGEGVDVFPMYVTYVEVSVSHLHAMMRSPHHMLDGELQTHCSTS